MISRKNLEWYLNYYQYLLVEAGIKRGMNINMDRELQQDYLSGGASSSLLWVSGVASLRRRNLVQNNHKMDSQHKTPRKTHLWTQSKRGIYINWILPNRWLVCPHHRIAKYLFP